MKVYSENECIEIQKKLNEKIQFNYNINNISLIAGVDIAYYKKDNKEYGACCIVIIDYNTKKIIEKVNSIDEINFPYIPGCLAFRELPLVLNTTKKLKTKPDLYIFDGNGYLHPRHMGIATHASLYLNTPTIGIAKTYYKIENVDYNMPDNCSGAYQYIIINNEVYGLALRTHENVKPIFISVGNYINLHDALTIVNNLITKDSHIPIPTRLVDIETHIIRKLCMGKYKMLSEEKIKKLEKIKKEGEEAEKILDEYKKLIQRKKSLNNIKNDLHSCLKIHVEYACNCDIGFEIKMQSYALNKLNDIIDN